MRELLLLLTLALVSGPALSQDPPKITRYLGDQIIRVNISLDSSKSLICPNREGFIGVVDREGKNFVTSSPSFTVDLGYTRGDLNDLQRMRRQRLGAYHCLYLSDGNVNAFAFVLTEQPVLNQISNSDISRVGTGPGEDQFEPYCRLTAAENNDIVWELYKDDTGLFEPYSTGRMLTLTYTALSREHGNGMTIFRCYNRRSPEQIQYNWAMYSENLQIRPVRASNYETTPLPYNVRYQSTITLECHGNGSTTAIKQPTWMFKPEGSDAFVLVVDDPPALDIKSLTTLSTVTIQRMLPKYAGFYKCDKDNINHVVQLKVNYGDVVIKDYSKGTYPMVQSNYIVCEIPEKSMKDEAVFTLERPGRPPLTLKGATSSDGFTTSFDSQSNLVIRFDKRPDVENARLVCTFFEGRDFTTIKTQLPKLTLTNDRTGPGFYFVTCAKDKEFGTDRDLKVHLLNSDGTLGAVLTRTFNLNVKERRFYDTRDPKLYSELVCVTTYDGQELRSNVLTYGTPEVTVDIVVEGERNPPRRVFLSGRDVTLECQFSRFPSTRFILPSAVALTKDGKKLALPQEAVNASTFRYVIINAGSSDNGVYRCDYANTGMLRAAVALVGNYRSSTSDLQFCTGSQFVCDMTCKNASLMCDKKQDCADGSDERPEYCDKCEPNEVKCEANNGRAPEKRCVLKHWLCDGQDDCGNGYDEILPMHSKWCYKERACRGCRPEETCCPNSPDKCIQRNYECDKESDCDGGTEELKCTPSQCLRITDPTSRQVIEKRVGDSFRMTCTAVGMDRPTINWRRNWAALPKDGVSEANEVLSRDPSGDYTVLGTLEFTRLTKDMSGIYNCEAVNNCKRELSYEIDLRISD